MISEIKKSSLSLLWLTVTSPKLALAYAYDEAFCPDGYCHGDGGAGIVAFLFCIYWWVLSVSNRNARLWFTYIIGGGGFLIVYNTHSTSKIFVGSLMIAATVFSWMIAVDDPLQEPEDEKDEKQNTVSKSSNEYITKEAANICSRDTFSEENISIHTQSVVDYIGSSNAKEINRLSRRKSFEDQKFLVTENDVRIFGEYFLDVIRDVAKESKFIDESYRLKELTSSYISDEDIDVLGGDLIHVARRIMEDVKRIGGISKSNEKSFIRTNIEDVSVYGAELIDIIYRVAQDELKVSIDLSEHPFGQKYLKNKCPFCGAAIIKSSRICESCGTGFSEEMLN